MEEELKVSTLFVHFSLVNVALLLFLVSILMIQFVNSLYHVSLPKSRFYYSRRRSKTWNIVIVFTFIYLSYVYIVWIHVPCMSADDRGSLLGVLSFPPPCASWGLNSSENSGLKASTFTHRTIFQGQDHFLIIISMKFFLESFMAIYNSSCLLSSAPFSYFSPPYQGSLPLTYKLPLTLRFPCFVSDPLTLTGPSLWPWVALFVLLWFFFF